MKKLVAILLASLLTICVVNANPLNYIQERGWKETEKTKEMNSINRPSRDGGEYVVASEKIEVVIVPKDNPKPKKTLEVKLLQEPTPEFEDSKWYEGMHWYNNGIIELKAFEPPEGFVPGRLK